MSSFVDLPRSNSNIVRLTEYPAAAYSQCRSSCPSDTGWACDTPSPTFSPAPVFPPTPVPSLAPTPGPTTCITSGSKCGGSSWTDSSHCCEPDESCFVKSSTYSQCKTACPSGTGWACDTPAPTYSHPPTPVPTTPAPTLVPTSCTSSRSKCGGSGFTGSSVCCER